MSTELTKIEYLRSKITSLADHIRAKAGKSDAMTFAELEAAVDGITTGSSGGGGSTGGGSSDSGNSGSGTATIENGYTINFYNTDNVLIESHSALFGMWIDEPISYKCTSWRNADGYLNEFPLTVENAEGGTVFDLYAYIENLEDKLYNHFEIDKETYPYLAIRATPSGLLLCFAKDKLESVYTSLSVSASVGESITDANIVVETFIRQKGTSDISTSNGTSGYFKDLTSCYFYTNYDTEHFTNWYDLRT